MALRITAGKWHACLIFTCLFSCLCTVKPFYLIPVFVAFVNFHVRFWPIVRYNFCDWKKNGSLRVDVDCGAESMSDTIQITTWSSIILGDNLYQFTKMRIMKSHIVNSNDNSNQNGKMRTVFGRPNNIVQRKFRASEWRRNSRNLVKIFFPYEATISEEISTNFTKIRWYRYFLLTNYTFRNTRYIGAIACMYDLTR